MAYCWAQASSSKEKAWAVESKRIWEFCKYSRNVAGEVYRKLLKFESGLRGKSLGIGL